jgi:MFS family permease
MSIEPKESRMNTNLARGEVLSIAPKVYARRWKTLAVLSLALLIIGLDNTILNVALPSLQEEFDASSKTLQWIVDSYLLVFAGLLLTLGTLGDRFGRKLALQAGLALFGGASLAVLLVDSATQLIVVRGAMGIGGALIMPATLSIITNIFPREERGKAIGIWAAMASIGIGLGPLCGGLLLEWFSWTSVVLVNVPVAAIALLAGIVLVPNSRDPEPGAFDLVGAALSVAALVALVYPIIEAQEEGWTNPMILSCFGLAALLAYAFVRWELHVKGPMLNLS